MTVLIVSFVRILSTLTMTIHFSGVRANIIEGLAGGKVDLPCNMTSTPVDDKPVLVLWYKDKVLIPVYTFDARTGPLWQGRHSSSDHLTGRAYLTTVDRPAKLIIEPLMLQDHGSYRCRVDFNRTRTRYTDSILKVIASTHRRFFYRLNFLVLPSKPLIKDKRGDILESLIGPYNEGESLKITCEVTGGIPVPSVSWWRETILLDDTATRKRMGPVINELTIPILKRHHLMATFSCVASNNNISAHLSTVVTVDMNFRPLVVEIVRSSQPFSAESPAQVKCWTAGSRPPAVIEWFKGNRQLKTASSNVSSHGNVTVSLLAFIPTVTDDEKPLSCSAMNPLIPDSTLTDTQTLDVRYKPQLNIIMTSRPNSFTAKEGGDVTLNCNIKAKPAVTTVNWVLEDQDLYTNLSAGVFVRNHTVLLASVDRSQSGIYKCVATNTQGMGKSAPFNLRIQYAPRCKENQMLVFWNHKTQTRKSTL
ncbi:cell adhesion molecule 2-like isoform X1 [Tachypleus tridentatus]|uniref:cell adhesion molecule 2-like isoform X1 n=1 Tax=Tachypleus tridentatus TaxID=6853 RepID=UPI003FD2234A